MSPGTWVDLGMWESAKRREKKRKREKKREKERKKKEEGGKGKGKTVKGFLPETPTGITQRLSLRGS